MDNQGFKNLSRFLKCSIFASHFRKQIREINEYSERADRRVKCDS